MRRCREYVKQQGGNPDSAQVFPDFAQSGASLERPGFEAMMAAVDAGRIKVIVTEDMSRISRDFADSAQIFKRLQFLRVPLIGVADGIDTSSKHAKLSFTVKSLVADIYLDDLRDKTLRGLEGRALAGFATGNVAYGYHTVPVEEGGRAIGNKIEIHPRESIIIRRIFDEARSGRSFAAIAAGLNRDRIPSPRVGSLAERWGDPRRSEPGRAGRRDRVAAADGAGRQLRENQEEVRRGRRCGRRRWPKTRNPWREQLLQGFQVVSRSGGRI